MKIFSKNYNEIKTYWHKEVENNVTWHPSSRRKMIPDRNLDYEEKGKKTTGNGNYTSKYKHYNYLNVRDNLFKVIIIECFVGFITCKTVTIIAHKPKRKKWKLIVVNFFSFS